MNTKFEKLVFLLILEKLKLPSLRTDVQSGQGIRIQSEYDGNAHNYKSHQ